MSPSQGQSAFPDVFPPFWASAWGEDQYGLFAEFEVQGILQRCRWIAPGSFLMGSPEDEPERWAESERPQHRVTLSGYWLADTACTQELWQAVMGNNPAEFKDASRNPVERVSWEDCWVFFENLNQLTPNLLAGFPTEAHWEYACRAGTTTPFSFGANITPEQVNYDGNFPYAGGKKGLYRRKTVPVASLPPNPWGLFEIHGNVLEWCSDWFGPYLVEPSVDPEGPGKGESRVLRGGSWFHNARYACSVSRYVAHPGFRSPFIGLRVAPGRAGPAEPA